MRSSRPPLAHPRRSPAPGPPGARSRAGPRAPCWGRCSRGGWPRTAPGIPPSVGCLQLGAASARGSTSGISP
eukprot:2887741-Alexandrium_andersonii.AAC.1